MRNLFVADATIATAARIEKACGDLGRDAVISGPLLARLELPPGMRVDPLGEIALAGKARPMPLYALVADGTRAGDQPANAAPAPLSHASR